MPDLKISQLTDGGALQAGDQIPVNRSGSNFRVVTTLDLTWADLLTAIGGSTLTPLAWYHITDAPDGSTTIDEAWVRARDTNQIFPMGMGSLNTFNISNRLVDVKFYMDGGVGGRIAGVYDDLKNVVEGYSLTPGGTLSTANIDAWATVLTAGNQSVKIYASVLGAAASGTVNDYSMFIGSTVTLAGSSNFYGICEHGTISLSGGSAANGIYIFAGGLTLDNGSIIANGLIGPGKSVSLIAGETVVGFSTERNIAIQHGGANPSGDTITVDPATGHVFVDDGSTDVTITLPAGVISGQRMTIFFAAGSAAVTWAGATTDSNTFIANPSLGYKIEAFWDALNSTWR